MKNLLKVALVAATAACALSSAEAATFKSINHGKSLVMTGEITTGDVQRLQQAGFDAEARYANGQPIVERIFLNSPGGQVKAGLEVANFIREWGIDTVIGKTDVCASMCAVVFAAGRHKAVFQTSKLGVHAINSFMRAENGDVIDLGEDADAMALTLSVARLMTTYGVPEGIINKMMTTRQPDTYWVTAVDGWTDVEVLASDAVITPNNPQPRQDNTEAVTMTCTGDGGQYVVYWRTDGVYFKDRWHAIRDAHQHPKTGAYVVTGPTKWGTYGAVFGGPKPRMEFSNGKEVVKDRCW